MKRFFIILLLPVSVFTATGQTKGKLPAKKPVGKKIATKVTTTAPAVKNTLDSASYAFGMAMATSLKGNGLTTVNYSLLIKGLKDVFANKPLMISKDISQNAINNAFKQAGKKKYASNIAEGKLFLEKNKKVEGVKTTASGLEYLVIKPGNGTTPKATDTVLVNYTGTLLNGKKFDSTYDRNEPLSLPLDKVIAGWTEGMQLMSVGAKYRFFIPYNLAYGERNMGEDIPPYSTLIFDVELLKINGK